jgi:hypothetical protein
VTQDLILEAAAVSCIVFDLKGKPEKQNKCRAVRNV